MLSVFDCGIAVRNNLFNKGVPADAFGEKPDADVWARAVNLGPGDKVWVKGHCHNFNHLTFVVRGSFMAYYRHKDATKKAPWERRILSPLPREFEASSFGPQSPAIFMIDKDVNHWLVSLEPWSEYACLYAVRDEEEIFNPKSLETWPVG